jgi:hypothetical protein
MPPQPVELHVDTAATVDISIHPSGVIGVGSLFHLVEQGLVATFSLAGGRQDWSHGYERLSCRA